jgi:peptidoglycan/LPS O-acetylase OafA/YrhL
MFYYCVFPFILFFLKKRRPDGRIMLAASMIFWAVTQVFLIRQMNLDSYIGYPSWSHDLIFYHPLPHFCSFFIGVCGAYYIRTGGIQARQGGKLSMLTTVSLLLVLAVMVQFQPELMQQTGLRFPFGASFYAPVMLMVLMHLTLTFDPLSAILSWSKFVLWGEMSYALFILQAPMDRLYKYFIPENVVLSPGLHFALLFILLASLAFLLTLAEKKMIRKLSFRV